MKKTILALACFIGLAFFTSCDPESFGELLEQQPSISFVENGGYAQNNSTVYAGSEINFMVSMSVNMTSASPLKTLTFSITDSNGFVVFEKTEDLSGNDAESIQVTESFTPDYATTLTVTATVEDNAGKRNTAAMTITCVNPPAEDEFIGDFAGYVNIHCDVASDSPQIDGQQYDTEDLYAEITLNCNQNDEAQANFILDGSEIILTGKRNGNKFTFDNFQYNTTATLIVDIDLNFDITMTGILEGNTLTISGDATGTGSALFNMIQADLSGNITGVLERVEDSEE